MISSNPKPRLSLFGLARQQRRPEPPAVTIVPIARGHAGKTACLRTLHAGIRDGLPSGLRLGGGNPLEVVKDIRRFHETREQLASRGMTQTLAPEVFSIKLHQAENTAATVHIVDVIGQVLTHTMPDSPEDQLARYADYLKFLVAADVLWVIASPPCMDTAAATERWADDLSILRAYLVEALRQKVQPCSVALVVTKVDTLFSNEAEARRRLGEGALQSLLAPLVDVVRQSSRVSRGAIFPISSLGFGCAVKQNGKPASEESQESEVEWLLRPGASVAPFNVVPLLVYSIAAALAQRKAGKERGPESDRLVQDLEQDLQAVGASYLPIRE